MVRFYQTITLFLGILFLSTAGAVPPDYSDALDENFDQTLNRNVYQQYLDAAPDGLGLRAVAQGVGGTGTGVAVCVVDYGFNANHADVPAVIRVGDPQNPTLTAARIQHGTAVIGVLAAPDNGFGVTGMVPDAQIYFAAIDTLTGGEDLAGAVTGCASVLVAGDVLLIAQPVPGPNSMPGPSSFGEVPAEWEISVYNAIQDAITSGISVVEAGGNGSQDLDGTDYRTGNGGHFPFLPTNDSGAIIVGSAVSAFTSFAERSPQSTANTGIRLNLQGWGQDVVAAGFDDYYFQDGANLGYTRNFSGGGAAAAMVAGAAALVQAINEAAGESPLTPLDLRSALVNTGTPQSGDGVIGPQPDLAEAVDFVLNAVAPDAPIINPGSGVYAMPIQVSIDYGNASQDSSNTQIRYTLNGQDPTEDSFIFFPDQGESLYLNYGVTVKARAFAVDEGLGISVPSAITTAVFTSSTPKVETPVITPDGGTLNQGTQVVIATETPGATIRYRTDGRSISFFYPGTEYTGPITLEPGTYEISARGYKDGHYKSDNVISDPITINALVLPTPTIYPSGGNFNGSVTAYIGSTVLGADIRYTVDGSEPTQVSAQFTEPLALTETTTLKARIYLDGYTPSEVNEVVYNVTSVLDPPVIDPAGGQVISPVTVTLSAESVAEQIRYTTNGAEPTSYSTIYTGPFDLEIGETTVKAKAFAVGATTSQSASADFEVFEPVDGSVEDPQLAPFSTQYFVEPFSVTMRSDTQGAEIRYTISDGGLPPDPTESSTLYTGPVLIDTDGSYFIKARAYRFGATESNIVQSGQLSLGQALGTTAVPDIAIDGANPADNALEVTLTAPQFQTIFYTTDGSEPVSVPPAVFPSRQYSGPFNVGNPATVRAKAYRVFFASGGEASEDLFFQCGTPSVEPDGGSFVDSVAVSLDTSTTSSATIYYTLDGSEPSEASTPYAGPIDLDEGEYVLRARCYRSNWTPSEITDRVFLISSQPTVPAIVTQPQDVTVSEGATAAFDVNATGIPSPQIQWQFNGQSLAGETEPLLEIGFADLARAGEYRAVVTNDSGSVISNTATLTVLEVLDGVFADSFEGPAE